MSIDNPTVSIETITAHLAALNDYLEERGGSGEYTSVLKMVEEGLSSYEKGSRIPAAMVATNLDVVAAWLNEPNLGLKLAPYSSRKHPQLDFFFRQKHFELKDLVYVIQRYLCICTDVMTFDIEESQAAFTLVLTPSISNISRHQEEGFVASLIALISQNQNRLPIAVTFTHAPPKEIPSLEVYEEVLKVAPSFLEAEVRIMYSPDAIGDVRRRRYPFEHSFEKIRELESLRQRQTGVGTWTDRCVFLLELLLCYGEPTKSVVAELLNTTPRTLQRRLEQEGMTFRVVLALVRQRLVKEYLQRDSLSHEDIAFLLGFTDVGVFYRAFKLWFGQPPSAFKS